MRRLVPLLFLCAGPAEAGLTPTEVIVLGAQDPPQSAQLAQRYQALRGLPPTHVCLLPGPYPEVLEQSEYNRLFWPRIAQCLRGRSIGAIVTTKGLPVRVGGYSLEALLALGDSEDNGVLLREQSQRQQGWLLNPFYARRPYDGLPPFRRGDLRPGFRPGDGAAHGLDFRLTSRLDGFDFVQAEALIERSIASDEAGLEGDWLCMKGSDPARAVRDTECLEMLDLLDELDWAETKRLDFDTGLAGERLAGYLTGSANLRGAIAGNEFPPGAIADNITSLMGVPGNFGTGQVCDQEEDCDTEGGEQCVESVCLRESQTSVARFIAAGVTGVHATAAEPYNNSFPSALVMAFYVQGYSLAESFFFSMPFLGWVNVVYGDPLAAPFARPVAALVGEEVTLAQDTALRLEFEAIEGWRVAQVDVVRDRAVVWSERFGRHEADPLLVWEHGLDAGDYGLELRVRSEPVGQELGPSFSAGVLWPEPQVIRHQPLQLTVINPPQDGVSPGDGPDPGPGCSCGANAPLGWGWFVLVFAHYRRRRRRFLALSPLVDDTRP